MKSVPPANTAQMGSPHHANPVPRELTATPQAALALGPACLARLASTAPPLALQQSHAVGRVH